MIISSWGHLILSYYMSFFWWKEIREVILNSTVSLLVSPIYILISSVQSHKLFLAQLISLCLLCTNFMLWQLFWEHITISETYAQPSFISLQCKCHILHQSKSSSYNILQFCSIASRPYVFTIMLGCLFSFFLLRSMCVPTPFFTRWTLAKCCSLTATQELIIWMI